MTKPAALAAAAFLLALVAVACGAESTPSAAPTSEPTPPSQGKVFAPDFTLASAAGGDVSLAGLLEENRAVVLVFYRGFF